MISVEELKLTVNSTIKEALQLIDSGATKIAIVVDADDVLIGTLTDGDIRRAILSGIALDQSIDGVFNTNPTVVRENISKEEIINICTTKKIYQIPVVDDKRKVISIDVLDELLKPEVHSNKVVLMVGGLGSRLRPLTENTPKPMLHVGGKPILQTIVESFSNYGYVNIVLCVNYKSHVIKDYFGDGSKFGVNIEYVFEDERLGTAGALNLLSEKPDKPFFVMNGDLLTNINFEHLFEFHQANDAIASMCVREYDFQVPYGVVNLENGLIKSIIEKPVQKFFVSAGIYMLQPQCIDYIPENQQFDMPALFEKLIEMNKKAISFPLREYLIDIGRIDEYEKANSEYHEMF